MIVSFYWNSLIFVWIQETKPCQTSLSKEGIYRNCRNNSKTWEARNREGMELGSRKSLKVKTAISLSL